jgi:glucose-6-phosphate isomerase
MKLRKNKLRPIRLELAGIFGAQKGSDANALREHTLHLADVRDQMMKGPLAPSSFDESSTNGRLIPAWIHLPERLLEEYLSRRQQSLLGTIFRRANRFHALADRAVVLGSAAVSIGPRAIVEACSQPYWNELSRGDRGSKPRLYFAAENLDNDSMQALLYLLGVHHRAVATSESERWGCTIIDAEGESCEPLIAMEQFLNPLRASLRNDDALLQELFLTATVSKSPLHRRFEELGLPDPFPIPHAIDGPHSLLTPAGLFPAALVGINVIELLEGAAWMTKHFETAPIEENLVLRFAAANRLLNVQCGIERRFLNVWNERLRSLGAWYEQLHHRSNGNCAHGIIQQSSVCGNYAQSTNPSENPTTNKTLPTQLPKLLVQNICVDTVRFDALTANAGQKSIHANDDSNSSDDQSRGTIPEMLQRIREETSARLNQSGIPSLDVILPSADELPIGQLVQMLMLASALESYGIDTASKSFTPPL